jgi:prepilin-type N-terminal cleavage/methylation domain-containing protein
MIVESQESRAKNRNPDCGLRIADCGLNDPLDPKSEIRNPKLRSGVTLIELLIVILIISILAALVLGVAAVAGETARQSQSRHIVERLHTLLIEHWDTYKTRRVKLRASDPTATPKNGIEDQITVAFPNNPASKNQALAEARLYAMREMMLMEVPDRWSDVLLNDVGTGPPGQNDSDPSAPRSVDLTNPPQPLYLSGRTELSKIYLRRYAALADPNYKNTITGVANTAGDIKRNQGAECLYMIVTLACGDGEARTMFGEHSIGDTDGDGAPEFLDGWGHPINFLRWAPGFDSQIELNANDLGAADTSNNGWVTAAAKDHDPFDLFRRDPLAFRLVPLIYSPGRDESSGLAADTGFVTWPSPLPANKTLGFNSSAPFITSPKLTPYQKVASASSTIPAYMGTDMHVVDPAANDETATDNVHNHLMGQR